MRSATLFTAIFSAGVLGHAIKRDVVTQTEVAVVTTVVVVDGSGSTQVPSPPAYNPPAPPAAHRHHHKAATAAATTAAPEPVVHQQTHSSASGPQDAHSYLQAGIDQHNFHRANHSAAGVTWDGDLAQSAAVLAAGCVFEHNTDLGPASNYGQNIASSSPATGSIADELKSVITDMWYNGEVSAFNGLYGEANPSMTNFEVWGHFTQVVWQGTKKIGCHTQNCPNMGYFTVCNYFPAGNMMTEFAQNVKPSVGEATIQA